jgi:thiamine pyrophosphokinase
MTAVKGVLLAGGTLHADARVAALVHGADLVVAADSGLRHARTLGIKPDLLVGDLDSVSNADLGRYDSLPVERHPVAKDATDLELALDACAARCVTDLTVIGAFGGRLDQTLAAPGILHRFAQTGRHVRAADGKGDATVLLSGAVHRVSDANVVGFSLLALSVGARVRIDRAAFEGTDVALELGSGLGLSNAPRPGVTPTVTVLAGDVLLVTRVASGGSP